jgi:hypothetical protein
VNRSRLTRKVASRFDDTIIDKVFSHRIELVRRQYSSNAHGLIKGIGMVNCVYVNLLTQEHWIIDYRIYDPDSDGKTKLDHVRDMLTNLVHHKHLPFRRVLMDTWYATRDLIRFIESLGKIYYCPLRTNRQVETAAQNPRTGASIRWSGMRAPSRMAQPSRSKAFPNTTR